MWTIIKFYFSNNLRNAFNEKGYIIILCHAKTFHSIVKPNLNGRYSSEHISRDTSRHWEWQNILQSSENRQINNNDTVWTQPSAVVVRKMRDWLIYLRL